MLGREKERGGARAREHVHHAQRTNNFFSHFRTFRFVQQQDRPGCPPGTPEEIIQRMAPLRPSPQTFALHLETAERERAAPRA